MKRSQHRTPELKSEHDAAFSSLAAEASGVIVSRKFRYVGFIVQGIEHPFHLENDDAFNIIVAKARALEIPVIDEHQIVSAFWLTAASGATAIAFLTLILG